MQNSHRNIVGRAAALSVLVGSVAVGCSTPSNRAVRETLPRSESRPTDTDERGPGRAAEPTGALSAEGSLPVEPRAVGDSKERGPVPSVPTKPLSDPSASSGDDSVARAPAPAGAPSQPTDDRSVAWPRSVDGAPAETLVATVGGRPVPLTDLVAKWIMRDPVGVRGILDDLILSRIVTYEAAALDVELPPDAVPDEVRVRVRELEIASRKAGAPTLEAYVKSRLGLDMDALSRELTAEATIDLLAPRCIRAWVLSMDRREIRAIALDDQAGVDEAQARLARGEDFADVAKDLSKDPSATEGGRMPPVVRGEQALAQAAFSSDVGTIAGPIQDDRGYVFIKIESRPELLEGTWDEVGDQVEASLTERQVEDPEFWQWKEAMFRRYEIDISPFLELAGR